MYFSLFLSLIAEEPSAHVDHPTSICFSPHSSLELACDIHVLLAHIQEAQTGSLDSSVDGITTPVPDAVGMSHAKKVLVHSCIDITDP